MLTYSRPYGVAKMMERVIARARDAAESSEREADAVEALTEKEANPRFRVIGVTKPLRRN